MNTDQVGSVSSPRRKRAVIVSILPQLLMHFLRVVFTQGGFTGLEPLLKSLKNRFPALEERIFRESSRAAIRGVCSPRVFAVQIEVAFSVLDGFQI